MKWLLKQYDMIRNPTSGKGLLIVKCASNNHLLSTLGLPSNPTNTFSISMAWSTLGSCRSLYIKMMLIGNRSLPPEEMMTPCIVLKFLKQVKTKSYARKVLGMVAWCRSLCHVVSNNWVS